MTATVQGSRRALLAAALAAAGGAGALSGCGGSERAEPRSPATSGDEPRTVRRVVDEDSDDGGGEDGFTVEGTVGHLDPDDIRHGLEPHNGALSRCYEARGKKLKFVDGKVDLKFKVAPDGTVRWVQMADSSLGAWAVERCLLEIARGATFAKPRGGKDAEFSVPIDFADPRARATWLTEEEGEAQVRSRVDELSACAAAAGVADPRGVWVTLYVGPRGKVKSAGFATRGDGPLEDAWVDCAEDRVLTWKLGDPRGRIVKLGFQYNAM
jgi:TonB family protein